MVRAGQRRLLPPWKSKQARGGLCEQEAGVERKAPLGVGKGEEDGELGPGQGCFLPAQS